MSFIFAAHSLQSTNCRFDLVSIEMTCRFKHGVITQFSKKLGYSVLSRVTDTL